VFFDSGNLAPHLRAGIGKVTDISIWGSHRKAGLEKDEAL
jgi:hypothetical protein